MAPFQSILLLADEFAGVPPTIRDGYQCLAPRVGPPRPERVAQADLTVVFGALESPPHASQLAGSLRAALHAGRTVVVAPGHTVPAGYGPLLEGLGVRAVYAGNLQRVHANHAAFEDHLRNYGQCQVGFDTVDDTPIEVLGTLETSTELGNVTAAFVTHVDGGRLYVVPYFVAAFSSSQSGLTDSLVRAVSQHTEHSGGDTPGYLAELRLPTEQPLLDEIANRREDLSVLQARAERLEGFRMMLGTLKDRWLESLVIEALNLVLESTGYRAEDREETSNEDFWLCGPDGDVALAEVKGINSGIGRGNVNQVDNHRERYGQDPEALPGLLIVNQHRLATVLPPKLDEHVHPDVRRHAKRQNVLVLRTADLYQLLGRALRGEAVGAELMEQLSAGGGWLHVSDSGMSLEVG